MRPRINFQKNGTSVPFFFFARYPKSKMDFRIVMSRAKQKHKTKKFFSRNTPPGLMFLSEEKHKVYSLLVWRERCWEGLHPRQKQRAANGWRGRSLPQLKTLQKIFVQNDEEIIIKNFTKPLDKYIIMCYNKATKNRGTHLTE